nr:MotA/TolQ/ExbB proton channel family protein [Formicincola oecophyllae]
MVMSGVTPPPGAAAVPTSPAAPVAPPPAAPTSAAAPASPAQSVPVTPLAPHGQAPAATTTANPYGLAALWHNGDIIARSVLIIMAIMSAGSWIIIALKFLEQSRLFKAARVVTRSFWEQPSIQAGTRSLSADSPFRYIAETGIVAAEHHEGSMLNTIDLPTWTSLSIQRAVDTIQGRLSSGLAFLGTVGSTSPFIGLFGTVWGIYHALTAIGIAGQASIDKVAGPVGESLIMTAIGLATAVPAVLGYNLLVRRNKGCMDLVRNFAADIQSVLIGGIRHGVVAQARRADDQGAEQLEAENRKDAAYPTTATTNDRV